jgi:hypothetical protein
MKSSRAGMQPAGAERHRHSPEGELEAGRVGYGAPVKCWEIIADNLSKAGWTWRYISAIDSNGRKIWIADAHRGDGQRCAKSPSEFWCVSITLPVSL